MLKNGFNIKIRKQGRDRQPGQDRREKDRWQRRQEASPWPKKGKRAAAAPDTTENGNL